MTSQDILIIDKLNKTIGKEKILSNISFSIPRGVICAFIGHNGAGKTTTIKSIMNLYHYDSGTILIDGIDAKKISSHNLIGYVPEKENFPKIKTKKFLEMMASLNGLDKKAIKVAIAYYERVFNLKHRLQIKLSNLSSGQKKKIMIIQALLHNPNLIIMDEPTENLDPDTRETFYQLIKKMKKQNKTFFISTHNLDEIQNFADFIVIISRGQIKKVC